MTTRMEKRFERFYKQIEKDEARFAFDIKTKKSYPFSFLKRCGIYAIECIQNKRIYIGQSIFIGGRICQHLSQLSEGSHTNNDLSLDYEIYGPMGFRVYVVTKCSRKQLNTAEQVAMKQAREQDYALYNKNNR